jgi:hypothetical protein
MKWPQVRAHPAADEEVDAARVVVVAVDRTRALRRRHDPDVARLAGLLEAVAADLVAVDVGRVRGAGGQQLSGCGPDCTMGVRTQAAEQVPTDTSMLSAQVVGRHSAVVGQAPAAPRAIPCRRSRHVDDAVSARRRAVQVHTGVHAAVISLYPVPLGQQPSPAIGSRISSWAQTTVQSLPLRVSRVHAMWSSHVTGQAPGSPGGDRLVAGLARIDAAIAATGLGVDMPPSSLPVPPSTTHTSPPQSRRT